jgi:hypothetical protein
VPRRHHHRRWHRGHVPALSLAGAWALRPGLRDRQRRRRNLVLEPLPGRPLRVAGRFDLRRDIQFNSRVAAAHFDGVAQRWEVTLEDGGRAAARFLITALGPLSAATLPRIRGVESFRGQSFHTYCWPHEFEELRTRVEKIKLGVASRRAKRFLDDMAFLKRDSAEKFRRLADQVRRLEAEDGPGLPEAAPRGRGKEQTT